MLNETINKDNYEAFYLDYLEGNLSPEQSVLFEQFLEENPDLAEADFEPLSPGGISLDSSFKAELKVFDSTWVVTEENIEQFLIAEKEGVLTLAELRKLHDFLSLHPENEVDRKNYTQTTLIADESVGFGHRSVLYRKKAIVLWPYWTSVAAAACIVAVLWLFPNNPDPFQLTAPPLAKLNPNSHGSTPSIDKGAKPIQLSENKAYKEETIKNPVAQKLQKRGRKAVNASIKRNALTAFSTAESAKSIPRQFDGTTFYPESSSIMEEDEASNDFALTMDNPVKPITRKLSDIIKQPVEYQRGTNPKASRKGFYLKIGKIEIYNNRKN